VALLSPPFGCTLRFCHKKRGEKPKPPKGKERERERARGRAHFPFALYSLEKPLLSRSRPWASAAEGVVSIRTRHHYAIMESEMDISLMRLHITRSAINQKTRILRTMGWRGVEEGKTLPQPQLLDKNQIKMP